MKRKIIRTLTVSLLFSFMLLALTSCGGKKVDLADSYTINYNGINGEGKVSIHFNTGTLQSQLKIKANSEKELQLLFDLMVFEDSIQFKADPQENLSNGQTVTITADWDKELAKKLKLSPVFKETSITIPNDAFRVIRKLSEKEVFDNVAISVSGIYPNLEITANYKDTDKITEKIRLTVEKSDPKKNTVLVSASMSDYDADALSVSLPPMTKEFKLENYSKYITDLAVLDKKSKEKILAQAQNVVLAHFENEKTQNVYFSDYFPYASSDEDFAQRKLEEIKLDRVFFLTLREDMDPNYGGFWSSKPIYNQSIFLYHLKLYHHKAPEGIDYFVPVFLNNIVLLANGELDFQLANVSLQKDDIRNIADDYKSLYINRHIDKYEGLEVNGEAYLK